MKGTLCMVVAHLQPGLIGCYYTCSCMCVPRLRQTNEREELDEWLQENASGSSLPGLSTVRWRSPPSLRYYYMYYTYVYIIGHSFPLINLLLLLCPFCCADPAYQSWQCGADIEELGH